MIVRLMRDSDLPILRAMYERMGFKYELPNLSEMAAVHVVVDEYDHPLMAVAAKKTIELYMFSGEFEHPAAKLRAIQMLTESMQVDLVRQGFSEVNAFLPPSICRWFGRRLLKLAWFKNWESYCYRL